MNNLSDCIYRTYTDIVQVDSILLKPYMRQLNISLARDKFRLRSKMTRTVKFNFPSDKKFRADMWRCWHCPSIDSQAHVRVCPAYQEFRLNKDLDNDKDLVLYFRQVIKLRDDMPSDEWEIRRLPGHQTGCTSASRLGIVHP